MRVILTIIFTALLIAGCATTEDYEKILQTWVGLHVDELVLDWGPPQSSFDLSTGDKIIEYKNVRYVHIPGHSYPIPKTINYHKPDGSVTTIRTYTEYQLPSQSYTRSCKTRFIISPDGLIKQWDWEGDDCAVVGPE